MSGYTVTPLSELRHRGRPVKAHRCDAPSCPAAASVRVRFTHGSKHREFDYCRGHAPQRSKHYPGRTA